MRKLILLIFLSILTNGVLAQEADYYQPKKTKTVTPTEFKKLNRWGPKLGLEVHASVNYVHLFTPPSIENNFSKAFGGIGFDGGSGIRIRAYHKLAFAAGFNYAIRSYNLKYQAYELGTNDILDVSEKATIHYLGFYFKTLIELSKKFYLAQTFQYTWRNNYNGVASAQNLRNSAIYPPQKTSRPAVDAWRLANQAELGVEFAYKWHISPELLLKPYI
ncbi:hypothetical protein ACFLR1_04875, partial [Bacteroidota bacterium]